MLSVLRLVAKAHVLEDAREQLCNERIIAVVKQLRLYNFVAEEQF